MTETPNLQLPYILPSQAQKHVTHNESLNLLDTIVQLAVENRSTVSPPDNISNGTRYIIPENSQGVWQNMAGNIATWQNGAWIFQAPETGWIAWIISEQVLNVWDGTQWLEIIPTANTDNTNQDNVGTDMLGINTEPDITNRLSVKTDAVLFSHDDVTPGNGSIRQFINKDTEQDTASLLFQEAFTAHAELGLAGDNNFHFKVSKNGSDFTESLTIDNDTGNVGVGVTQPASPLHVAGEDQAIALGNTRQPENVWSIIPGRNGFFADNLIITASDSIDDVSAHRLRIPKNGSPEFIQGIRVTDGQAVSSHSSSALAFWRPFTGTHSELSFRGALNSGKAEYRLRAFYHDGSFHSQNVANWVASDQGPRLGIGVTNPTCTLHLDGAARVGNFTLATLPDPTVSGEGAIIYIGDEAGGATIAFSDGIDWRRMADRAVVS